jgi:hypothetical protein
MTHSLETLNKMIPLLVETIESAERYKRELTDAVEIERMEIAITQSWGMHRDLCEERGILVQIAEDEAECARLDAAADEAAYYDSFDWHQYDDLDDCYEQRRDEKAERDADARQDR